MRIILSFILFYSIGIHAMAVKKVSVSPEPGWIIKRDADLAKKPVYQNISDGYYLELIDQQVNLLIDTKYTHFIRHIINESGVQNASEVSVTFSPEFQQVIFHKLVLIRNGKEIGQLMESQIKVVQEETDASDFQYNGLKRAFVTLKDVRNGDRIEVAYSVSGANPVFSNKYDDKFYFYSRTSVCNYFVSVITSPERKLFVRKFNNAPDAVEQESERPQGTVLIYEWRNPPLKAYESVASVPSWYDNYPHVSLTEYASWAGVIDWGVGIFKDYQYSLPASLEEKIAGWHKMANGDKDSFATMAIRFVQDQVRYLGLEMGSYTHQPHSPAEVYQHRFGDCKDKALLLAVLLRKEGIPAYVALLNTSTRSKLPEAAPSPGEFDHAIVAIERSAGTYIYIDATSSFQRGSLANLYIPAYGYALILRKGDTALQAVTTGSIHSTNIEEILFAPFKDTASLTVKTVYAGGSADNVRSSLADISASEMEENYRKYYAKLYDGVQHSAPVTKLDDSAKNEVTINEAYSIPRIWHTNDDGREALEIFAKPIFDQFPNPATATKNAPIAIEFPMNLFYTLEVNMPDASKYSFSETHVKNDSYQYDFVPVLLGSQISLRYTFKTFKDHIPLENLAQYKKDYKKIDKDLDFRLYSGNEEGSGVDHATSSVDSSLTVTKNINWPAVWFSFIFLVISTVALKRLDKRSEEMIYNPDSGWLLGGWTIVLGITIALGLVAQVYNLMQGYYFRHNVLAALGKAGGMALQSVLFVELALNLFLTVGAVALLYWFIGRRDIFPRMFTWYLGIMLSGRLLLIILYGVVPYPTEYGDLVINAATTFGRSCIYAGIWYTYIRRSERVRGTFLQPPK